MVRTLKREITVSNNALSHLWRLYMARCAWVHVVMVVLIMSISTDLAYPQSSDETVELSSLSGYQLPCEINVNNRWAQVRNARGFSDIDLLNDINTQGPKGHPVGEGGPGAVDFNGGGARYTGNRAYGICESDKILAAHGGVISARCEGTNGSCDSWGGYVLRVKTGTIETVYAHADLRSLQHAGLKSGDTVVQGQRIGTIGATGAASGPHIHFWSRDGANGNFRFLMPGLLTRYPPGFTDHNGDGIGDIYILNRADTREQRTSMHVLNGAATYQNFLLHRAIDLGMSGNDTSMVYQMGDYNRDGKLDLYVIDKQHGGSGRTDVHVLDGATNFQTRLLAQATTLHKTGSDGTWMFLVGDYNRDGILDLYAIDKAGGSGRTDIHVLNGADSFQSFLLHQASAFAPTGRDGAWVYQLGDYNGDGQLDLYGIDKIGGASGKTDVHILDGADKFRSKLVSIPTALHVTGSDGTWLFQVTDYNRDTVPDLLGIVKQGGSSGTTEVHVLNGANGFQSFLLHSKTALHTTGQDCTWVFPQSQCALAQPAQVSPTPQPTTTTTPTPTTGPGTPTPTTGAGTPTPPPAGTPTPPVERKNKLFVPLATS
jgi:hypothetical protein